MTPKPKKVKTGPKFIKSIEWAAGIFEGEGSLFPSNTKGTWGMKVGMSDPDCIQDFFAAVGFVGNVGGPYIQKGKEGCKPMFVWQTEAREVIYGLVKLFLPYMGKRRTEKAEEFLHWYLNQKFE